MANPVPYQQLFDIDGLNAAIRECEGTADEFSAAVTEDFKRINSSVQAIKKSIEALNASMGQRTIKLVDETSQQAIVDYAKQVVDLTKQVRDQQTAITNLNEVINANKVAVSDAKVAAEQFKVEQQNLKAQQEATKLSIAQQTLSLEQQKQALTDTKLATAQSVQGQQQNKTAISASNLANQQYITTIKQNQAAQSAATLATARSRQEIAALALANKQAAQAQTAATGSYNEAVARLKALGNEIKNTKDGFNSVDPALNKQIMQYNALNDKLKAFDASMGNHQRNVGNYGSSLDGLVGKLSSLALGYISIQGALAAAKETFDLALQTDANRTSLQYILGNIELADIKIKALKATANSLGLEFISLSRSYVLFTGAAKASNFSLTESDKVFNSVARASAVLHLSADKTAMALYALQEMISKGVVQSKELQRQLAQAIPGAAAIMADALGVTNAQLREMEKSGELIASEVLPKFAAQLDKTFAPGIEQVNSLQASLNKLKNTFSESVDENTHIKSWFETTLDRITVKVKNILGMFNSTSWYEALARLGALAPGGTGEQQALTVFADSMHRTTVDPTEQAISDFSTAAKKEQIELLKTQTAIRDAAYEKAKSNHADDIKYLNEQQALLVKLRDIYKQINGVKKEYKEKDDADLTSIKEIRDRITELSKLPTSAVDGSAINNRIDALKKRLHDLTPSMKVAKDGFQVLEEQIKKTMLALQDSIIQDYAKHQGKESENTKKLADAYNNLNNELIRLQKLRDEAILKSKQDAQIKALGSLFPLNTKPDANPSTALTPGSRNKRSLGNDLQIAQDNIDISGLEDQLDEVAKAYSKANKAIVDSYKARNLTKAQMDAQLLASESQQADNEYYLNVSVLIKQLEIAKLTYGENSKEYNRLLLRKAKLDEQYGKKGVDDLIKQEEAKRKIIEETIAILEKSASVLSSVTGSSGLGKLFSDFSRDAVQGIGKAEQFQATAQIAIDATSAYTDFAINASKSRQAVLENEMQYEITGAGDNAEAKKKIEEEYTKKINAEKTKQAKAAKAAAEIEIIVNTAVAASKVFGQTGIFGIGLAPIIIGLGLAELAIVAASPIPQFEKGRTGGPATPALVNEKGPELLVKNGKGRFANSGKKGYTFLQKDEKVFRADETARYIDSQLDNSIQVSKSKQIYDTYISTNTGQHDIDYDKLGRSVGDAVSKLPLEENNWNEKGYQRYSRTSNARIKSVRDRNKL